ncbi:MAG: hypothetical protein IJQ79_02580 [Bacteroidales bacterium]|nr:hypothetical protein [Bacteroidales bacterium]
MLVRPEGLFVILRFRFVKTLLNAISRKEDYSYFYAVLIVNTGMKKDNYILPDIEMAGAEGRDIFASSGDAAAAVDRNDYELAEW